jgi:hypothetical protein
VVAATGADGELGQLLVDAPAIGSSPLRAITVPAPSENAATEAIIVVRNDFIRNSLMSPESPNSSPLTSRNDDGASQNFWGLRKFKGDAADQHSAATRFEAAYRKGVSKHLGSRSKIYIVVWTVRT